MDIVGADHEIKMRDFFKQFFAAALRHTAHNAEQQPGMFPFETAQDAELADRLEFRLFAHAAGVQDDQIGRLFRMHDGMAGFGKHRGGGLAVPLVHLAAVSLDVDVHFTTRLLRWITSSSAS